MLLPIWTVYENPRDYPGECIARMFLYDKPTQTVLRGTLAQIRAEMQRRGLTCLPRLPGDDPVIVECWL